MSKPKTGKSSPSRWQIVNILEQNTYPAVVHRNASSRERYQMQTSKTQRSCVILKLKRSSEHALHTIHVAFNQDVSVCIRLPRCKKNWSVVEINTIRKLLAPKSVRAELFFGSRLVGYEIHDVDADLTKPMQTPYLRCWFNNTEHARSFFNSFKTKTGVRNPRATKALMKCSSPFNFQPQSESRPEQQQQQQQQQPNQAKLHPTRQSKTLGDVLQNDAEAFSVHHLSTAVEEFYHAVNTNLTLPETQLLSLLSWITLSGNERFLSKDQLFANSQRNAFARIKDIVAAERCNETTPMTTFSFDLEQYRHAKVEGTRKREFPKIGIPEDEIRQIAASVQHGEKQPIQTVCFCVGPTRLTEQNKDVVKNLELRCFQTEIDMLMAFFEFFRDSCVDVVTGYNTTGFDFKAILLRLELYALCQQYSYDTLHQIQRTARRKIRQYNAVRNDDSLTSFEKAQRTKEIFGNKSNDYSEYSKPKMLFYALSEIQEFSPHIYRTFKQKAGRHDVRRCFYASDVVCQKLGYIDVTQTGAYGEISWRGFDYYQTGWALFDAYMVLKKTKKLDSFSLKNVMKQFLPNDDRQKIDLPYETLFEYYESQDPFQQGEAAVYCARDAEAPILLLERLTTRVEAKQNAVLLRMTMAQISYTGTQAKVISKVKEICQQESFVVNEYPHIPIKGKYQGATVAIPVPGFHEDPVATLDFASLYPSIIIAINICFQTFVFDYETKRHKIPPDVEFRVVETGIGKAYFVQNFKGVFPKLEDQLLAARRAVKKQMKATSKKTTLYQILNARQLAIKVLCNSAYGFMGVKAGKMPLPILAASITSEGRRLILQTKTECEKKGYEVIYGDTDSVMVKLVGMDVRQAWDATLRLETHFKQVFEEYGGDIDLEAEKVYYPYLLWDIKKRYAGRKFENPKCLTDFTMDVAGLEMKRTDATPIMKHVQKFLLETMMPMDLAKSIRIRDTRPAILDKVTQFCTQLINDKFEIDMYQDSATTKSETSYKGPLPVAVQVRLKHNQRIRDGVMEGETIPIGDRAKYVAIYKGRRERKNLNLAKRAEDPEYVKFVNSKARQSGLYKPVQIDRVYYLDSITKMATKFLIYHAPDIHRIFDTAQEKLELALSGQDPTKFRSIAGSMFPKLSPELTDQIIRHYRNKRNLAIQTKRNNKKPKRMSSGVKRSPTHPASTSSARFTTKKAKLNKQCSIQSFFTKPKKQ